MKSDDENQPIRRYDTPVVFTRTVVFGEDVYFEKETMFYENVKYFGVVDFKRKNTFWNRLKFLFRGK